MWHSILLTALLGAPGVAAPAAAPAAPAVPAVVTEAEVRALQEDIDLLQRMQELPTPALQAALPCLDKVDEERAKLQPFQDDTLRVLRGYLEKAREAVLAGRPVPAVLRQEIEAKSSELEERKGHVRAKVELAAWAAYNALDPARAARFGESGRRREIRERLGGMLDEDLRTMPAAAYEGKRTELLRELLGADEAGFQAPPAVAAALDKAREQAAAIPDDSYAGRKQELMDAWLAQVPLTEDEGAKEPEAERKERERQAAIERLSELLSAPGIRRLIALRLAGK